MACKLCRFANAVLSLSFFFCQIKHLCENWDEEKWQKYTKTSNLADCFIFSVFAWQAGLRRRSSVRKAATESHVQKSKKGTSKGKGVKTMNRFSQGAHIIGRSKEDGLYYPGKRDGVTYREQMSREWITMVDGWMDHGWMEWVLKRSWVVQLGERVMGWPTEKRWTKEWTCR